MSTGFDSLKTKQTQNHCIFKKNNLDNVQPYRQIGHCNCRRPCRKYWHGNCLKGDMCYACHNDCHTLRGLPTRRKPKRKTFQFSKDVLRDLRIAIFHLMVSYLHVNSLEQEYWGLDWVVLNQWPPLDRHTQHGLMAKMRCTPLWFVFQHCQAIHNIADFDSLCAFENE